MRQFTGTGGRLRALSFHARAVYSVFLLFTVAGLVVSVWLTQDMVGRDVGATEYYSGKAPETGERLPPEAPSEEDGPALELPEDMEPLATAQPMARRKLLEVTHFHLFSMPVYLLILTHLYILSAASARAKMFWVSIGTLGTLVHIVAPWAMAGSWPLAGSLFAISGIALGFSYAVMCLLPLIEMWTGIKKRTA